MWFKKFRAKHKNQYDLRKELGDWVEKNLGAEYVDEALEKYDKLNSGVPIGGVYETLLFIEMVERVKAKLSK